MAQPCYRLRNGRPRDEGMEALRFPNMVALFHEMTAERGNWPPTQGEFEYAVLERVRVQCPSWAGHIDGILGRASRTYISLVTQYHAYLVLDERYTVLWDIRIDLREKVDLVVILESGRAVGLALRSPTQRSGVEGARKAPTWARQPFPVVELVVQERAYIAGDFWLYPPEALYAAVAGELLETTDQDETDEWWAGYRVGHDEAFAALSEPR